MDEKPVPPDHAPSKPEEPGLSDEMLAMDVVDTLRHREGVALRELEQEGQGLQVSDRILDEGIRALRESRFTYQPTPPSFRRTLAGLWIRRGTIGKVLAVLVILIVAWIGWSYWQERSAEREAEAVRIEI